MEIRIVIPDEKSEALNLLSESKGFSSPEELLNELIVKELEAFDQERDDIAAKLEALGYM